MMLCKGLILGGCCIIPSTADDPSLTTLVTDRAERPSPSLPGRYGVRQAAANHVTAYLYSVFTHLSQLTLTQRPCKSEITARSL